MIVIVMGVTGAGKTTVGGLLAEQLHWEFADADDFHPAANVAKIRQGIALGDADRRPWLERLHNVISTWIAEGRNVVLAKRLRARQGHFAGEQILAGQFVDLEEPEGAVTVDIASTPPQIVADIRERLGLA